MADDRTHAAGPSRSRLAWRAGLRPRARWLGPAVACGGLALAIEGVREAARMGGPSFDLRPGTVLPGAWLGTLSGWLGLGLVGWALLGLGVAVLSRRLGMISTVDRRRLRVAAERPAVIVRGLLVVMVGVGLGLALQGGLAGAARSVDASAAGLTELWLDWAVRGSATVAVALGVGAAGELWLDRGERAARLRQSRQQLRDQLREGTRAAGGRPR